MPAFTYRAVDPGGKTTKGVIEASSAAGARAMLRDRKLLPIAVDATRRPARAAAAASSGPLRRTPRMSAKRLALVTRQLATLIGAQVRIEEALRIVALQSPSERDASLLLNLRGAIVDGRSLAGALDDYPATFSDFYRASVRAGQASDKLAQVMDHLALHVEEQQRNRQTLQLALIYPALLTVVSLGVIVALLTFVVPDIVRVFSARGAELPFLTRSLIALSEAVTTWGLPALGLAVAGAAGAVVALRRPAVRRRWHRALARGRLTRGFVLKVNAARFTGTLATLVQSGVQLDAALRATADTVPNLYVRERVAEITRRVVEGSSLRAAAEEARIFPPMLVAMIASGEAGGTLGASLSRSAAEQSHDLKAKVATLVALVEPAVLLLMGGIVMLLVLSILLPIVGLNNLAN